MAELNMKDLSKEERERALHLLQKDAERREKIKRGEIKTRKWSEMTDEQKEKAREASRRREAKRTLLCQKAEAAGITVSDDEVAKYLKEKAKK